MFKKFYSLSWLLIISFYYYLQILWSLTAISFWLQFLTVRASCHKSAFSTEQLLNLDVFVPLSLGQTLRCGRIRPLFLRLLRIQAKVFHQNFFLVQHKHNWWSQIQFPASVNLILIPYLLIPKASLDESYMSLHGNIFQLSFSHIFWFCVCIHLLRRKTCLCAKKISVAAFSLFHGFSV